MSPRLFVRAFAALTMSVTAAIAGAAGPAIATPSTDVAAAKPDVHTVAGQPAEYEHDVWAGGEGIRGKFVFTNGGDASVSMYRYSITGTEGWVSVPAVGGDPDDTSEAVKFVPDRTGPFTLEVEAWGRRGWSPAREHRILVASPARLADWLMDEGAGRVAADSTENHNDLRLSAGTSWAEGVIGSALQFDDLTDVARTEGPVVDRRTGVTVGALVRLDSSESGTAISVRGAGPDSALAVGYVADDPECPEEAGSNGCFQVWATSGRDGEPVVRARAPRPVELATWYMIAATYNPYARQGKELTIYTCDGHGPVFVDTSTAGLDQLSRLGRVEVGRDRAGGAPESGWSGLIDRTIVRGGAISESAALEFCLG